MEKWESEQMWPAHEVLKKLGNAGLLGINKPVEYGGLGLDWKYNLAVLGMTNNEFFGINDPKYSISFSLC